MYSPRNLFFALLLMLLSAHLSAHNFGEGGHLIVEINGDMMEVQFDLTTGEMTKRFSLDKNQDGKLAYEEEMEYPSEKVIPYILEKLSLSFDNKPCPFDIINHRLMQHGNGNYVRFLLDTKCEHPKYEIGAEYNLLFDENADHRGSLHVTNGESMVQMRFFSDQRQQSVVINKLNLGNTLLNFTKEGIWHIWIGIDHILFLICLILPAVFVFRANQWQAKESLGAVLLDATKIVTAFTIAHSITLVSAVLGWVPLPPARLTESIIALSVVVVAVNCIWPFMKKGLWALTFGFGLIHGFGFANALLELALPPTATGIALAAFNIGVELGQLMIVAVLLPILYLARKHSLYQPLVLRGGSGIVCLIAFVWLVERAVDVDIVSFI